MIYDNKININEVKVYCANFNCNNCSLCAKKNECRAITKVINKIEDNEHIELTPIIKFLTKNEINLIKNYM